jgi:hypothetical protein
MGGGISMCGGHLPHIANSSLVDLHCTLYCPANRTGQTQRRLRAEHSVAAEGDLPSLVTSSNCRYCPTAA